MNKNDLNEFLKHSNWIENERRQQALDDAHRSWRYAYRHKENITLEKILRIHWLLLRNIDKKIAGNLRTGPVWIGGIEKYYISEGLLKDELNGFLEVYDSLKKGDEKEAHVLFESIHPFFDGNGRVGRILYNIHRLNNKKKIHIIHEGEEQLNYYSWFKNI